MIRTKSYNKLKRSFKRKTQWMNTLPKAKTKKNRKPASMGLKEIKENIQQVVECAQGLESLSAIETPVSAGGLGAYGCVYHTGAQTIAVTEAGDTVPVKFSNSAFLSGVWHEDDMPDLVIKMQGIYEISYMLYVSGITSTAVAFAVQADGETLPGSLQSRVLTEDEQVCGGMLVAELYKDSKVRVVMTSGTVVNAELKGSGVTASLILKKLD